LRIAARQPINCGALLSHPHGAMPNLTLTRAEVDDLIGCVETLR
jgi:hypothetical protein